MSDRINLSPTIWGPKTWFFLDSTALGYPSNPSEEEKTSAKNLLLSLKDLLPCGGCRDNYKEYLNNYLNTNTLDDVVKDKSTFIDFIVKVHNDVRVKNNSQPFLMSDVFTYYKDQYMKRTVTESFDNNKLTMSYMTDSFLTNFNPITLLIGLFIGLILYKLYDDNNKRLGLSK